MFIVLANICINIYGFIDKKFVKTICQILKIKLQYLIEPK